MTSERDKFFLDRKDAAANDPAAFARSCLGGLLKFTGKKQAFDSRARQGGFGYDLEERPLDLFDAIFPTARYRFIACDRKDCWTIEDVPLHLLLTKPEKWKPVQLFQTLEADLQEARPIAVFFHTPKNPTQNYPVLVDENGLWVQSGLRMPLGNRTLVLLPIQALVETVGADAIVEG